MSLWFQVVNELEMESCWKPNLGDKLFRCYKGTTSLIIPRVCTSCLVNMKNDRSKKMIKNGQVVKIKKNEVNMIKHNFFQKICMTFKFASDVNRCFSKPYNLWEIIMRNTFLLNMPKTNNHINDKRRAKNQKRAPFELIPYKNISF